MTHKLTIFDRLSIWGYIARVELAMPELFTHKDFTTWKQIRKDLVVDICAQARKVGVRQAIADLGPATILGTNYQLAIRGHRPVLWAQGFLAAAAVWMLIFIIALSYVFGAVSALVDSSGGITSIWNVFGILVQPTAGDGGFGATLLGFGSGWWIVPLILVVIFLVASRVWRLWRHDSRDIDPVIHPLTLQTVN